MLISLSQKNCILTINFFFSLSKYLIIIFNTLAFLHILFQRINFLNLNVEAFMFVTFKIRYFIKLKILFFFRNIIFLTVLFLNCSIASILNYLIFIIRTFTNETATFFDLWVFFSDTVQTLKFMILLTNLLRSFIR